MWLFGWIYFVCTYRRRRRKNDENAFSFFSSSSRWKISPSPLMHFYTKNGFCGTNIVFPAATAAASTVHHKKGAQENFFTKLLIKKIDRILINRLFLLFNGYFIKEIFCFFLSFNINTAADSRSQQMMVMMTNCCCCNWHTFSLHTKKTILTIFFPKFHVSSPHRRRQFQDHFIFL